MARLIKSVQLRANAKPRLACVHDSLVRQPWTPRTAGAAARNARKSARAHVRSPVSSAASAAPLPLAADRTPSAANASLLRRSDPWLVRPRGRVPAWIHNVTTYVDDPLVDADIPKAERRGLLELDGSACCWPVGDPSASEFFFCGAHRLAGKPYCARHWARAFVARESADALPQDHRAAQDRSRVVATKGEHK